MVIFMISLSGEVAMEPVIDGRFALFESAEAVVAGDRIGVVIMDVPPVVATVLAVVRVPDEISPVNPSVFRFSRSVFRPVFCDFHLVAFHQERIGSASIHSPKGCDGIQAGPSVVRNFCVINYDRFPQSGDINAEPGKHFFSG